MSLADFALKRPVTVLMLVIVVIIMGTVSLTRVGLDLLPEMNLPIAAVITEYRGVGPEEIETLITRPWRNPGHRHQCQGDFFHYVQRLLHCPHRV